MNKHEVLKAAELQLNVEKCSVYSQVSYIACPVISTPARDTVACFLFFFFFLIN